MRRVCGSPHSSLRAESDLPAWKVWGCLLRRTVSQPVVHQAAENIFRLITCAANEHAFSLRQASKQKKNKTTTKKSTSKQNEENKSYKLTLKPEPSWCLFLSENHISSGAEWEALLSPEQGWRSSALTGGSSEGKWAAGLTGVLPGGAKQMLYFLLLFFASPLCFKCVHGWRAEEKSN